MKIVILWDCGNDRLLAETMENLIVSSQCFLFTVVCNDKNTAAYKWATANGAPVEFLKEDNLEKLLDKIVATADYLVAYNDGNQIIKRLIMKFKSVGKHGTIINQ